MIARLRLDNNWAMLLEDSTISSIVDVIAESEAEIARYGEYLLNEKKWKTAQNMTSIETMTDLISAKRRRPISATGFIVVSHTDEENVDRLINYGKYFFSLDNLSNYDNIIKDSSTTFSRSKALVPWTCDTSYTIPKGTIFTSKEGIQFIATESVSSRALKDTYASIQTSAIKKESFLKSGGWNGIKYIKVPIIQGTLKTADLGVANAERFETFILKDRTVEDASNQMSKDFFKVILTLPNSNDSEEWVEVENIKLAGPYDKVYETRLLPDSSGIQIKFGDGINGKMPLFESQISCSYLSTMGALGNVDFKYQITKMTLPNNQPMIDPRTNTVSNFLSCMNISAVSGGEDLQSEDEFKRDAPLSYIDSYALSTIDNYEKQIMKASPLNLSRIKCFSSSEISSLDLPSTDNKLGSTFNTRRPTLGISAVLASGEKIEDPDETFIKPLMKLLSKQKGPNDFFQYIEPNFIKFAVGATCKINDMLISDKQLNDDVTLSLLSKYSIFSTDFKDPLYLSKVNHKVLLNEYIESSNLLVEALANVSFEPEEIQVVHQQGETIISDSSLIAIPFKFDKIFSKNVMALGFKNYKQSSPYLLKIDINFNSSETMAKKNRTLFLYDNRIENMSNAVLSLQESKKQAIDKTKKSPSPSVILQPKNGGLLSKIELFDETQNGYTNRQVRVAQFLTITDITDDTFMTNAKNLKTAPNELRPYDIDPLTGENKLYALDQVLEADRVSTSGEGTAITGTICYKRNNNYIPNIDIIFDEKYEDPNSIAYASGFLILPMAYLDFMSELSDNDIIDEEALREVLSILLKNNMEIKVHAIPNSTDFEPDNNNDLLFIDEKSVKTKRIIQF